MDGKKNSKSRIATDTFIMNTATQIKDQVISLFEVQQPNGHMLRTTVMKKGKKLITGTPVAGAFLRNEWAVNLNNYVSLSEALDDLYEQVKDGALAMNKKP